MTPTIVVHGGAGGGGEPQLEGVRAALEAGRGVLSGGGTAVDAAVAAVASLEADGRFNAGRGAVRTKSGGIELDAAVMEGTTRAVGAVAGLRGFKHPIAIARALLDERAVLLVGDGANAFATTHAFEAAPYDWFSAPATASPAGTVGAVAVDHQGVFAVATSTGGVRGQVDGRVGDTPVIGAGTYANAACAISATGDGELFIRAVFSHSVATAMEQGTSLADACAAALADVASLGGDGGCIAIGPNAEVVLAHNSAKMPAGWATVDGALHVALTHS